MERSVVNQQNKYNESIGKKKHNRKEKGKN